MVGEKVHGLGQLLQVEGSRPTRIPGSLSLLQLFLNVHQQVDLLRLPAGLFFLPGRMPLLAFENRKQHIFGVVFSQGIQPDRTAPALTAE